jgi:serine/threonine-protein kinase
MSLNRAVEIIKQVGGALDAAHEQGVVHRDLKSENIMLVPTNSGDYAKVLDFGIAKIKEPEGGHDPRLTAPDLVIGTPQYMSPEQCSQSPDIDSRSDIYSLGVILYEMLVGHVPFTGPSPTAIMMKHLQEQAPSILAERDDLPAAVGLIVSRALAKLPENRYQEVMELVEDLSIAAEAAADKTTGSPETIPTEKAVHVDEAEDETLVRPRAVVPIPSQVRPQAPAVASNFNPWKILIPSMAGLLIVFGVIYAFTRGSETSVAPTEPSLVADPNSQPVESVSPPTGRDEQNIPTANVTTNQSVMNTNASPSPSQEEDIFPPNANLEPSANTNANANSNNNSNRSAPVMPLPSPSRSVNTNSQPDVPTPGTKPTNPPVPSPTVSAPAPRR